MQNCSSVWGLAPLTNPNLLCRYGTCWPAPDTEDIARAINGTDGKSWKLPLPPIGPDSFEPRSNVIEGGLV